MVSCHRATEPQSHRATEPQSHRATEPQSHRAYSSALLVIFSLLLAITLPHCADTKGLFTKDVGPGPGDPTPLGICADSVADSLPGMGTEGEPYVLCLPVHLSLVASGGDYGSSQRYILGSSLDLSGESYNRPPISGTFKGSLRGGGYTIRNLSLRGSAQRIALFEKLGSGGLIHGLFLFLEAVNIESTRTSSVFAGAIVAEMSGGEIINSYAAGSVSGGSGENDYMGGLVGLMERGKIIASYAKVKVSGGDGNVDFVGGLVGEIDGSEIIASYATGEVDGGMGVGDFVAGLVGRIGASGSIIIASYATGNVDMGFVVGNLRSLPDGTNIASYGFGTSIGGSDDPHPNSSVTSASDLTAGNAGDEWSGANSPWIFGGGPPRLGYITGAEYNSGTMTVTCFCAPALLPEGIAGTCCRGSRRGRRSADHE